MNLEQVGRTDATNGRPASVWRIVTGFDYSNLGAILDEAAQPAGIAIKKDLPSKGDYFERSDNLSFARAGVPAHTMDVAAEFSDYHEVGDEWQKIDYANMASSGSRHSAGAAAAGLRRASAAVERGVAGSATVCRGSTEAASVIYRRLNSESGSQKPATSATRRTAQSTPSLRRGGLA